MKKAIKELWDGDINPYLEFGKDYPKLDELRQAVMNHLDELLKTMETNGKLYDKCFDTISEYALTCAEVAFSEGFSLGVKLTAEAFCRETQQKI